MKKLFVAVMLSLVSVSTVAQIKTPNINIESSLDKYEYFYVTPTTGIVSSAGGGAFAYSKSNSTTISTFSSVGVGSIETVNPSDVISGFLMNNNYKVHTSIVPELAEKTLIITYGYIGRRYQGLPSYVTEIILQFRDAKTQELVASIKTEGAGNNESGEIKHAIYKALTSLQYALKPEVKIEIVEFFKRSTTLHIYNKTPNEIKQVKLNISYFDNDTIIHQQQATIKGTIAVGDYIRAYTKRDKPAQNKKYPIKIEVVDYQ